MLYGGVKQAPAVERSRMGKIYGYCRVSSRDQKEDRQLITMKELKVPEENIFIDKQSGKDFDRPQYKKLMRKIKAGDVLYVKSIDRLGRNYKDIIEQWKVITKDKGADIVITDMPLLDTTKDKDLLGTFISDLVLAILSYVSENERCCIHRRQAEGIAAARARGVHFGRKPRPLTEKFYDVYQRWSMKKITVKQAAAECGMPATTFYDRAKKYGETSEI